MEETTPCVLYAGFNEYSVLQARFRKSSGYSFETSIPVGSFNGNTRTKESALKELAEKIATNGIPLLGENGVEVYSPKHTFDLSEKENLYRLTQDLLSENFNLTRTAFG